MEEQEIAAEENERELQHTLSQEARLIHEREEEAIKVCIAYLFQKKNLLDLWLETAFKIFCNMYKIYETN